MIICNFTFKNWCKHTRQTSKSCFSYFVTKETWQKGDAGPQLGYHKSISPINLFLSPVIFVAVTESRLLIRRRRFPRPVHRRVPCGRRLRVGHQLPQPARVRHHLVHVPALLNPFKTATFPRGFLLLLHKRALRSTSVRVLRDPLRPPLVLRAMVLATVLVRVARAGTRSQGAAFLEVTHSQESLPRGKSCEVLERKYCPVFTVFHNRFSQVNQKLAKGGMISGPLFLRLVLEDHRCLEVIDLISRTTISPDSLSRMNTSLIDHICHMDRVSNVITEFGM